MKALVYTSEKTLEYRETPNPETVDNDVLIKVESVGLCGSDMHAFLGHDERRPAPLILGHEAAGTIVSGPDSGKRVTVNPLVTCGTCDNCKNGRGNICANRQIISMPPREGAFAEYISMPMQNLVEIPDNVSFDQAALCEPIACGWHAVRLAERVLTSSHENTSALAIGGGAIGLGAALSLKANGYQDVVIVEANEKRRNFITEKTDFKVVAPAGLTEDQCFDLIIDGVGIKPTREMACRVAKPGGVIAHIGLGDSQDGLDIRRMTLQEISFIGCYTYTHEHFCETAEAIFNGGLGSLDWVEFRNLSDGQSAFEDILAGNVCAPKIVLKP
ncbi:alcohol dehydrogenase catalytic domain-containing protein [Lentilitoribacter sp. EG35]|jgi:threonine dehydrogenase-like Zn-dependent dehydrogenase|uniref:alcohol dehydrogenase catalytic domain-containing protein n=1 Tax=Lentilitoribacter sp. EG35 TaxID=3234192 RepID=UPI0034608383